MGDIKDVRVLWLKFGLFLLLGSLALTISLLLFPSLRLAALMGISIWAFCRAYYFAFYVIGHYVDPNYRFAGLVSLLRYVLERRSPPRASV